MYTKDNIIAGSLVKVVTIFLNSQKPIEASSLLAFLILKIFSNSRISPGLFHILASGLISAYNVKCVVIQVKDAIGHPIRTDDCD